MHDFVIGTKKKEQLESMRRITPVSAEPLITKAAKEILAAGISPMCRVAAGSSFGYR